MTIDGSYPTESGRFNRLPMIPGCSISVRMPLRPVEFERRCLSQAGVSFQWSKLRKAEKYLSQAI